MGVRTGHREGLLTDDVRVRHVRLGQWSVWRYISTPWHWPCGEGAQKHPSIVGPTACIAPFPAHHAASPLGQERGARRVVFPSGFCNGRRGGASELVGLGRKGNEEGGEGSDGRRRLWPRP